MAECMRALPLDQATEICRRACPYAALVYVSCLGGVSYSRLNRFLMDYTIARGDGDSRLIQEVIDHLLRDGHIYETRGGSYSALPSYAIQRKSGEWLILGDARADQIVRREACELEVTSQAEVGEVVLERLLTATDEDARRVLRVSSTRVFDLTELVRILPDTKLVSTPKVWPGYMPATYAGWQTLNELGRWGTVIPDTESHIGLCRGLIMDSDGRIRTARHFFRHSDGWSPITYEEASLWVFRLAAEAGKPYSARYSSSKKGLVLPIGLPYIAYTVLRLLGQGRTVNGDKCVFEGIDDSIARIVCQKLNIELSEA